MKSITRRRSRIADLSLLAPSITVALVIAGLYYGRAVLIPFALALLLSFLLAPPVTGLERMKLGRVPSVVLVLLCAASVLGGMLWLGATQLADIVSMLPSYQENIHRKIEAMRNPAGPALTKAVDSITTLSAEFSGSSHPTPTQGRRSLSRAKKRISIPADQDAPVPVELVKQEFGIVDSIGFVGMLIVHFAELAGGVLIFTLFMLVQRSDLRNRLFRLFGEDHLNTMTTALDDAARRVSKYLLTQSLVNGTFGLLLGFGLYWIGVPNAAFWGVLAAILRFIPYVGSLIGGICPLLLALAVFEGWTKPLLTVGLFATIELTVSSAVEPWLYGAHTGLSSLAILVSAAFWTLLWGPIGLVLSTPLTVCLLVMGRYIPALSSLGILLGDQPVLPPEACYYQRLLAGDEDESQEVAEAYLKDHTLVDLYESVLIPALSLAEYDRHDAKLDEERAEFIYQNTRSLIEELESQPVDKDSVLGLTPHGSAPLSIVCVGARDAADAVAGLMLRHVLRKLGHNVELIPIGTSEEMFNALNGQRPDIFFVSALPPLALSYARSMCRRIRQSFGAVKIVVGVWNSPAEKAKAEERWRQGTCDFVITSLREADGQLRTLLECQKFGDPPSEMPLSAPTNSNTVAPARA